MSLVVDASICLSWLMPDEAHQDADEAVERVRRVGAVAPVLWWYEVRNAIVFAERRRRLRAVTAEELLDLISSLPVTLRTDIDDLRVLSLARKHRLTFYDAAYLDLAIREGLPLATLDQELRSAALREGVSLVTA